MSDREEENSPLEPAVSCGRRTCEGSSLYNLANMKYPPCTTAAAEGKRYSGPANLELSECLAGTECGFSRLSSEEKMGVRAFIMLEWETYSLNSSNRP